MALNDLDGSRLYSAEEMNRLAALGEVIRPPATEAGTVPPPPGLGDDFDVLITSWSTAPFDPGLLRGGRLRLAVHSAGSVRRLFPIDALGDGLRLAQGGSDAMAEAVAEMALTMTLSVLRNVTLHDRRLQSTRDWRVGGNGMLGQSLAAQRVGVVSLSRVGRHYVRMLRGLGVTDVQVHDPYATEADAAEFGAELCELDDLCARSDVLALHAPSIPETVGMIGAKQLALLRDGAIIINTARAEITDEQALIAELVSGRISAALDVFTTEPLPTNSALLGLENVLLTPHVAGGTVQARFAQGRASVDEIERFVRDGALLAEVTPQNYHRLS
ncbi:hydroxyacid dehydrogenase [Microbacterium sp. H1-D42]|uniref:hydroxyacid dehydrogenase n=1 Tax=Microbacterium sp. H1-D42 TaxID=2925844 RepID=UPI001F539BC5|nr:hydroxyacid dehydrogenase [Microbacterium sp. H1-D42]UNK70703.1 hydroxyacid dehydrogenase [Microbacterium sp. H1-D42]